MYIGRSQPLIEHPGHRLFDARGQGRLVIVQARRLYVEEPLFLEAARVDYVVAVAENKVLSRRSPSLMRAARRLSKESGKTEHVYGECAWAAGTWSNKRRVIIKAEVVCLSGREPKDNPRFVVTRPATSPKHVCENVYCARGEIEHRISRSCTPAS
jgi:hypothetical protein